MSSRIAGKVVPAHTFIAKAIISREKRYGWSAALVDNAEEVLSYYVVD
jgi:hypothetical protein